MVKSAIHNGAVSATDEQAIATLKEAVRIERESLSPVPDSDDEEEKENRKRKRIENLENARKVKKTKEPRTKGKLKTASARVLKESQVLCGEETQAVLNQLDDYLYTYHYGRPESGSKGGENSEDNLEYSQQQHFSDDDDDATQLPDHPYNLPAYHGADFESQPIL